MHNAERTLNPGLVMVYISASISPLNLCVQVTRLALMNSKLTQSLSMHNLASSFDSDSDHSAASVGLQESHSSLLQSLAKLTGEHYTGMHQAVGACRG